MSRLRIALVGVILLCGLGVASANDDELAIKQRSDQVVSGHNGFEDKVRALRQYVHDKMKLSSMGLNPDQVNALSPIQKLDSGLGGYCSQQADVFMQLAQKQGITTRLVHLFCAGQPSSCHTIAEAFDGNRWVIVDTMFDLELKNASGQMASRDDVTNDLQIIRRTPNIKELIQEYPERWEHNEEWLKIYSAWSPFCVKYVLRGETN